MENNIKKEYDDDDHTPDNNHIIPEDVYEFVYQELFSIMKNDAYDDKQRRILSWEMWMRIFKMYGKKPYYNKLYMKVYSKVQAMLHVGANRHLRLMGFRAGKKKGDGPVIGKKFVPDNLGDVLCSKSERLEDNEFI
jgi:hypothetical protein